MKFKKQVKRGDIWFADLPEGIGSEHEGYKPVLIIQNDVGNRYSPTTIVAVITSKDKKDMPTHVDCKLYAPSVILLEQIKTIDKSRLVKLVGMLGEDKMLDVEAKLKVSLGMTG